MFNFFGNNINLDKIKNIHDVTKVTKVFIKQKKWPLGYNLIKNAKKFEKENYEIKISQSGEDTKKIDTITKSYDQNIKSLEALQQKIEAEEAKYSVDLVKVRSFDEATKAIKVYAFIGDWEKAYNLIDEVKELEQDAFLKLKKTLEKDSDSIISQKEIEKQQKAFHKKIKALEIIHLSIRTKEKKHNDKQDKEKFKIRFKKIKSEISLLSKTGKSAQALTILKSFLEDNKDNSSVIKFYNKEKAKILKGIEAVNKRSEKKAQLNIRAQALKLAGKTIKIDSEEIKKSEKKEKGNAILDFFRKHRNFYKNIKDGLRRRKLIDEVTLLVEENEAVNKQMTEEKLQSIHKGLTKEIKSNKVLGYDLYGKILGADKISGDTFGLFNGNDKYCLFLGDATGHGIKAGLIVTLLTRLFNKFAPKKPVNELAFEINNGLKQDLQSRNFITGILFEIEKYNLNKLKYVGMGHEPMLVYKKKINQVQKVIPGGLAAGIRMIKSIEDIKTKELNIDDGDIILTYSDGVIESKGANGEFYGLERLQKTFLNLSQTEVNVEDIYEQLIENLVLFRGGTSFDDDTTMLLLKRDKNTEIQEKNSQMIKTLKTSQNLTNKEANSLVGKNKNQIETELQKIKKQKELKLIISNLKKLYEIGEFLKLKQEAIRYIKEGWIDKQINFYLKKAIDNETKYKVHQKNKKIENRYNVLEQLMKKGDYETVIQEIEIIIAKDGDI